MSLIDIGELIKTERPITLIALGLILMLIWKQTVRLDNIETRTTVSWTIVDEKIHSEKQAQWLRRYLARANVKTDISDEWPDPFLTVKQETESSRLR